MSAPERRRSWFHGGSGWWQFALRWLAQSGVAAVLCLLTLGSFWGPIIGSVLSTLLLFRQVSLLVEWKLAE